MKIPAMLLLLITSISCQGAPAVKRATVPPANLPPAVVSVRDQPVYENEEATQDFLQLQIDRSTEVKPPEEPAVRAFERTVYVDQYGDSRPSPVRRSTFPIQTAIGAGVGAIIGHQSGDRGEGAAIGAGVGLLLDFMSWR
ncbi:MAG: glycine zipper family protein [Planctomycetota bacterium]|jgi:hypothetical protein